MNTTYEHTWVFLSHSNEDFEKLRMVRDRLEELKFRPLLFFLKCLEDDDEILDLIKREIEARERFILCRSKFSKQSKWVKQEVAYVESLKRPYEIIDLDAPEQTIEEGIMQFNRRSTIYLWSKEDCVVKEVKAYSELKAFKVIQLNESNCGNVQGFQLAQSDGLNGIVDGAYFIVLQSPDMTAKELSSLNAFAIEYQLRTDYVSLSENRIGVKRFAKQVVDKLIDQDCRKFNVAIDDSMPPESPVFNRDERVEMPIGKYARTVLTSLLERGVLTSSQIHELKDADFCKAHLNMNYPVLVDTRENGYDTRRYYKATATIAPYVICNDWYENRGHRAKLNQWLLKNLLLVNGIVV